VKRIKLGVLSVVLSLFVLTACSTTPVPELAKPEPTNVVSAGGMVRAGKDFDAEAFLSAPPSLSSQAILPSCRSITYRGNSGTISVQTSSAGTVAWGIYMNLFTENPGRWTVSIFVNGRKVDGKVQFYAPHGSVSPRDAKRGGTFSVASVHTSLAGITYYSVQNACRIP